MRLEIRGEYPRDWHVLSLCVKNEAAWRCVRCSHPFASPDNNPPGTPVGYALACDADCNLPRCKAAMIRQRTTGVHTLTVHHLDGDKANCRWWNLLALCNSCHLTVQARVIVTRPWLFAHSEWFIPYVCGFYASYYGGVEITRAEAIADPARWLALNPAHVEVPA